jgi:hypothetical protein
MAKLFGCRVCRIELVSVELADGSIAVVCSTCDVIVEHNVARRPGGSRADARSARTAGA